MALYPLLSASQGSAPPGAGGEVRNIAGTLLNLESGDVACYLTFQDGQSKKYRELGDFSLCTKSRPLIGKQVTVSYRLQNVMADECQGNTACKKTKTVALVTAVAAAGGNAGAPAKAPAAAANQKSLCTAQETIVFSCRTGEKMVSACASPDAGRSQGYLQYRYGKPEAAEAPEMALPANRTVPSKAATGSTVSFSGGGGAWLRFRNGQTSYTLYTGVGKWGPKGATQEKQGIAVERGGKLVANLKCSARPASLLGPDWFDKVGLKDGGEDFDFPD
jgi:hypothetical protein